MKTSINFEINSIESISRQTDWFINYRIDMKFSLLIFLTSFFFIDTLAIVGDSQAHSTGRSSFRAAPWRHSRVKISNRFDFNSIRVGWRFRRFFQDWSARSTGRSSSGAVSVQPRDLNRWEKTGEKPSDSNQLWASGAQFWSASITPFRFAEKHNPSGFEIK